MALTADHLIVIGRGRLVADLSVDEFIRRHSRNVVLVRSPDATELTAVVNGPGVTVEAVEPGVIEIEGLSSQQIGEAATKHRFVLHELRPEQASLEEAFMNLTRDEVEYHATTTSTPKTQKEEAIAA
jgi:ABC-2 type transport system ATP-binding protein